MCCRLHVVAPLTNGPVDDHPSLDILTVQKSDIMLGKQVLIITPTTVYRQFNGSYYVSVVNPTAHKVCVSAQVELGHAQVTKARCLQPNTDVPEEVAGIQVLWPPTPFCEPVGIYDVNNATRTVGCQAGVDITNQIRIHKFKPLDWDSILKLELKVESYKPQLIELLDKHHPAFAADLDELAIMEGVYYQVELKAKNEPVDRRALKLPPAHE